MEEKTIRHVPAPGYTAGFASGMTIHGPSADGLFHVTYFREVAIPVEDAVSKTPGGTKTHDKKDGPSTRFEVVRHNIATISVHRAQLIAMAQGLNTIGAHLANEDAKAKQKAASDDAG